VWILTRLSINYGRFRGSRWTEVAAASLQSLEDQR
jgi:hypothetical protein